MSKLFRVMCQRCKHVWTGSLKACPECKGTEISFTEVPY